MSSSAPDLSRVLALSSQATHLQAKGHAARAVEKMEQAVDAALAAMPCAEQDSCLILASLRALLARALESLTHLPGRGRAQNADALACAYGTLLPAAMTALEARRTAGTLMPGCCRPAEVAWNVACLRHSGEAHAMREDMGGVVARMAAFMGYQTYMMTASLALWAYEDLAERCSDAAAPHAARAMACVVSALELVAAPRSDMGMSLTFEAMLINDVSRVMRGDVAHCFLPLLAPWRRLQESGVLRHRNVGAACAYTDAFRDARLSAADAAATAPERRACALPCCGAREAHVSHFKLCAACKTVVYCCKAHQAEHWPAHKAACKTARAAAATQS
jgi:hypothetical protein